MAVDVHPIALVEGDDLLCVVSQAGVIAGHESAVPMPTQPQGCTKVRRNQALGLIMEHDPYGHRP